MSGGSGPSPSIPIGASGGAIERALDAVLPAQLASPLMLMHGALQGGWVWEYAQPALGAPRGVKGLLERAGFRVFNPTLPCHWPNRERNVGCKLFGRVITAQMYVDSYLQVIQAHSLVNVTLVAHSLAGVWAQLLVQQAPLHIERLILLDAVLLETGESFALNHIGWPAQALSTLWLGDGTFGTTNIAWDGWRGVFVQTRADNATFLQACSILKLAIRDTFGHLVPEPRGPCLEHLNMDRFFATPVMKVYIIEDDDISISAWGTGSQWSTFAARLSPAANGEAGELLRLLHVAADHQGMLTAPLNVARAVAAATAIGRVPEGQLAAEAADDRPAAAGAAGGLVDTLDPALYPARPAADASAAQVATAAGKATALAALRREVTARSAAATGTADG